MIMAETEGDRVKRASRVWHAFTRTIGVRIDLVRFARDADYEKSCIAQAQGSGNAELAKVIAEWLGGTPAAAASPQPKPGTAPAPAAPAAEPAPEANAARYLRGVR